MAYPANPARMPIVTSENIRAMIVAANRPRVNVRERWLLDEGSEYLVIRLPNGGVLKIPRFPERLAGRKILPDSKVGDNRIVDFALSFNGVARTLVCGLAGRLHSDRGFGINPVVIDLIRDRRPKVQLCLPRNMQCKELDRAIRLPLPTALILKILWLVDRLFVCCGMILLRVGMLPMIVIRLIAVGARFCRFIVKSLRPVIRPVLRIVRRLISSCLRFWDCLRPVIWAATRWTISRLETLGVLQVFAVVDRLDQRSRLCHGCFRVIMRVLVEIRWLLESFNVSVCCGPASFLRYSTAAYSSPLDGSSRSSLINDERD